MKYKTTTLNNLIDTIGISEGYGDLISYGYNLSQSDFEDFIRLLINFTEPPNDLKLHILASTLNIKGLPTPLAIQQS